MRNKQYVHFPAQIVGILCTKLKKKLLDILFGRAEFGTAHRDGEAKGMKLT